MKGHCNLSSYSPANRTTDAEMCVFVPSPKPLEYNGDAQLVSMLVSIEWRTVELVVELLALR